MTKNNDFTLINAADLLAGPLASPVDFVLPGLPAGQAALLAGADGANKTGVALGCGLSVACGIPLLGGLLPAPKATGRVLYLWGEDDADEVHRRLDAWMSVASARGVDPHKIRNGLSNLEFHPLDGERMSLMRAGRGELDPVVPTHRVAALLKAMHGARLTIIDPLIMFHDLQEGKNEHLDPLMRLFISMARQSGGGSVLIVHHVGQDAMLTRRDDHQSGRAGTALACAARAVWVIRTMSEIEEDTVNIEAGRGRVCNGPKMSRGPRQPGKVLRVTDAGVPWLDETATAILMETKKHKGKKNPEQEKATGNGKPTHKPRRGLANVVGANADKFDQKTETEGWTHERPF
jgi:RecA-family ATPase